MKTINTKFVLFFIGAFLVPFDVFAINQKLIEQCSKVHSKSEIQQSFWYSEEEAQNNSIACHQIGLSYYRGSGVEKNLNNAALYFAKAAEYDVSEAQYLLGKIFLTGEGNIPKKPRDGMSLLLSAVTNGYIEANYDLANILLDGILVDKNESTAFELLLNAAEKGHFKSQVIVGRMYNEGIGVKKDKTQAVRWFGDAAEKGDAESEYNLGIMFLTGDTLPKDENKAAEWIKKSASQGFAQAEFILGSMYEEGRGGIPKDIAQALGWYRLSAQKGVFKAWRRMAELDDPDAQYTLAISYINGDNEMQKSPERAILWLEKAALRNHAKAQYMLGHLFLNGADGVAINIEKSVDWLKKASKSGYHDAETLLWEASEKIKELNKDKNYLEKQKREEDFIANNIDVFNKAEAGDSKAQFEMGSIYENRAANFGGRTKDVYGTEKSLEWYNKAANAKNIDAIFKLGLSYFNGGLVKQDYKKALDYFKKASDLNHNPSLQRVGFIYENGMGVETNPQEALKWYLLAAKSGSPESMFRLGEFYYKNRDNKEIANALPNAHDWLRKASGSGVVEATNLFELMKTTLPKEIETIEKEIEASAHSDEIVANMLASRVYSENELLLSDLFYAYAANSRCVYTPEIKNPIKLEIFNKKIDFLRARIGEEKTNQIQKNAEEIANIVSCNSKEGIKARDIITKAIKE